MKNLLYLFFLLFSFSVFAQCGGRYQQEIFDAVSVETYTYSELYNLKLDLYQPEGDAETSRPLIILAHGGLFVAGSKTNPSMVSLGQSFAKRGYVVASISYRLMSSLDLISSESAMNGVVKALSDGRAAVRFFRKSFNEGNPHRIDPNQIYFGGNSAGGIIAVHAAFMNEDNITDQTLQGIININGGINGNSGNEGYSSGVNGAISLAGAIFDLNFIGVEDSNKILISCHGKLDATVPYLCGQPLTSPFLPVLCGGGAMFEHTEGLNFENHNHLSFGFLGHVPWEFIGGIEDQVIDFVSEALFNNLNCNNISLEEIKQSITHVFPNPTKNNISLSGCGKVKSLYLKNIYGETVLQKENSSDLNLEKLPSGLYFIHGINQNNSIFQSSVIKH